MPVATTDTRIACSRAGSMIAPTMMLASSSTSWRIGLAASSTSYSVKPLPPVIDMTAPPLRFAGADHGGAHFAHDRAYVREVEIDEPLLDHKVSNARDARAKHLIRHPESVGEGRPLVGDTEQVLIRNDNQRIDRLAQFGDTGPRDPHAPPPPEGAALGRAAPRRGA